MGVHAEKTYMYVMLNRTIADYQKAVVNARTKGENISMPYLINKYIEHNQRSSRVAITEFIYRTIGEEYRSIPMTSKIEATLNNLIKENKWIVDNNGFIHKEDM